MALISLNVIILGHNRVTPSNGKWIIFTNTPHALNETEMKTILLIEDNNEILENFTEFLEIEGYKILGASNGTQGIELAVKFIPDVIICDVLMPEMDGYQVLHSLLETSATYQIPFIFSTSMSEKVERAEALSLGADDYIIKPFDMEVLLKMIKIWLKTGSERRITTAHQFG
jgi:DNA-binding response OmpR family regulator